jgi:hypothetical protein
MAVSKKALPPATTGIKGDEARRQANANYYQPSPEKDFATTGIYGDEARRQAYANAPPPQNFATTGIKGDAARRAALQQQQPQYDQYGRPLRRTGVSSRRNR